MRQRTAHTRHPLVVVVACLAMAAHLVALGHSLLVSHVRCAEHGEVIDIGHLTGQAPLAPAVLDRLATAGDHEIGEGHEHCGLLANRRERAALLPVPHVLPAPVLATLLLDPTDSATCARTVDRLLLAPKTSPPL